MKLLFEKGLFEMRFGKMARIRLCGVTYGQVVRKTADLELFSSLLSKERRINLCMNLVISMQTGKRDHSSCSVNDSNEIKSRIKKKWIGDISVINRCHSIITDSGATKRSVEIH